MRIRVHLLLAALVGLALRLFFVFRFPLETSDSAIYDELARNWLATHSYGVYVIDQFVATDMRMPGYPGFLAVLYSVFGSSRFAVLLAQAVLDVLTCFVIAAIATALVPQAQRRRTRLAAIWLAATCPFIANYCAVVLTEVLATFLTAAALLVFLRPLSGLRSSSSDPNKTATGHQWLLGAVLVGLATLVRPESPLLLVAVATVLLARWWQPSDWSKLIRTGGLLAMGLLLPLTPWAARNWITLHKVQLLGTRFAEMPGELVPRGFYAWTNTWLVRFRDVYLSIWKLGEKPISMDDLPATAFDSADERARVTALVAEYNTTLKMTPELDNEFAQLARERTARHPLRTWARAPLGRAATLWFTPRIESLPYSGHLWPIGEKWEEDSVDFSVTLAWGLLNCLYVLLGIAGLARAYRRRAELPQGARWGIALLVLFILIRTGYLMFVPTPEPRYVLECFPALLALAALAWMKPQVTDA